MNAAMVMPPPSRLFDDDPTSRDRYEIIDGQEREMPPMSTNSAMIANRLTRLLGNFGESHELGEACTEVLIKLPLPVDRNRRPDVAFVPYSRWPKYRPLPDTNAWAVLPDLCVEVVSPSDLIEENLDQ